MQGHEKTGRDGAFYTVQNSWIILCVTVRMKKENQFKRYLGKGIKRLW